MYVSLGGCLGVIAKLGPLERSENCAGLSGLDDKLMTHILLEIEEATGLLLVDLEVVVVVVDIVNVEDVEKLVVEPLFVIVVVVVAGPVGLLPGRTTLVSLSKKSEGVDYPYLVADYDDIHFFWVTIWTYWSPCF